MDKTGAIEQLERNGKTYVRVKDYQKMREGVGMLLAELMRIKAEGDYDAIKALVDKYGVHFDPKLRDQVVARYKRSTCPTVLGRRQHEAHRSSTAPEMPRPSPSAIPRDAVSQYLDYGAMYDASLRGGAEPVDDRPAASHVDTRPYLSNGRRSRRRPALR